MSCVIEEIPFDPTDFDKALGDLLIGHEGHTQEFLVSIFGFLKRKTNFFKEPEPKRKVLEALRTVGGGAAVSDGFKGGFFGAAKPAAAKQAQVRAMLQLLDVLFDGLLRFVLSNHCVAVCTQISWIVHAILPFPFAMQAQPAATAAAAAPKAAEAGRSRTSAEPQSAAASPPTPALAAAEASSSAAAAAAAASEEGMQDAAPAPAPDAEDSEKSDQAKGISESHKVTAVATFGQTAYHMAVVPVGESATHLCGQCIGRYASLLSVVCVQSCICTAAAQ
jgi:hypothetical protein